MARSMRVGGGGRFAAFKSKLMRRGYSAKSAAAIAASRGRKKYGKKKMAQWSVQGRRRARKSK